MIFLSDMVENAGGTLPSAKEQNRPSKRTDATLFLHIARTLLAHSDVDVARRSHHLC